jgi:hypothetical protein
MNIPGKLRYDLKRIYGAADPLNYIEDIRAETNTDARQEELVVRLRVPSHCEKYMDTLLESPAFSPADVAYIRRLVENESYPPRFMLDKQEGTMFAKPKQVFLNGNHTTLVWPNGEKTTVGVGPDTEYDEYAGFCAAIVKKLFGSSREAEKFLDRVKIVQKKKEKKKNNE